MIQVGDIQVDFSDPVFLGLAIVAALLLVLIVVVIRNMGRKDNAAEPMLRQMSDLSHSVQSLSEGQHQLLGGLQTVSNAQANAQAKMIQTIEKRLAEVQKGMTDSLHGSSVKTTRSLTELQERLKTID